MDLISARYVARGPVRRSVGIAPVTVGVMRVRTIAAIMGATVAAEVEMIAAKILFAAEA